MIGASKPWADLQPQKGDDLAPQEKDDIQICLDCELPVDACDTTLCPFHLSNRDIKELERQIALFTHQIVNKPVYRAVKAIRKELEKCDQQQKP